MNNHSTRILSIILSFFILGATTSWTFNSHYCGSIKVATALFTSPENCGMSMELSSTPKLDNIKNNGSKLLSSCCNELEELVAGQQVFKQAPSSIDFTTVALLSPPAVNFEIATTISLQFPAVCKAYEAPPPLGDIPIYIYIQEFLI